VLSSLTNTKIIKITVTLPLPVGMKALFFEKTHAQAYYAHKTVETPALAAPWPLPPSI